MYDRAAGSRCYGGRFTRGAGAFRGRDWIGLRSLAITGAGCAGG